MQSFSRQIALLKVAENGAELKSCSEELQADPDVALAAIEASADAWNYAARALRDDQAFQVEAVSRNWQVLELLDAKKVHQDKQILLAAARQSPKALANVSSDAVKDEDFVAALKGTGKPRYEGENLRLVGHCNQWRTTDSGLRFSKVAPDDRIEGLEPAAEGSTRHELVMNLALGSVSFQIISCCRLFNFRIFPTALADDGYFRVAKGSGAGGTAVGGGNDGHGCNFYIKEKPDTIVRLYVDINEAGDSADVFYVCQKDLGALPVSIKAVSVSQGPKAEKPKAYKAASNLDVDSVDVLSDLSFKGDLKELIFQARTLSEMSFPERFSIRSLSEGKSICVLANRSRTITAGYLIYSMNEGKGLLKIEELAVVEKCRHKGLGKKLLKWAINHAEEAGCTSCVGYGAGGIARFLGPHGFANAGGDGANQKWEFSLQAESGSKNRSNSPGAPKPAWFYQDARGRSASPARRGGAGAKIMVFIGSHIESRDRIQKFSNLLDSIAAQKPDGPPDVFVSWSASAPDLRAETRSLLSRAFNEGMPGLRAAEQTNNLSQFQHFNACLRGSASSMREGTWIMFSDDDDLWHPNRVQEYQTAIAEVQGDRAKWVVGATRHAMLKREPDFVPRWANDVDHIIGQGSKYARVSDAKGFLKRAEQLEANPGSKVRRPRTKDSPYYFDLAIRAEQMGNFIMRTPSKMLESKFCDRRFLAHFCTYEESSPAHWFAPEGWLYFYNRAVYPARCTPADYAAGGWDGVSKEDYDTAEREYQKMKAKPDNYKYAILDRMGVDGMSHLIANLKNSLEEGIASLNSVDFGTVGSLDLHLAVKQAVRECFVCKEPGSGPAYNFVQRLAGKVAQEVVSSMNIKVQDIESGIVKVMSRNLYGY